MGMAKDVVKTARETEPEAAAREPELAAHPGPVQYVIVAVILAVATLFEVGLFYVPGSWGVPRAVIVGLLLFFMGFKFALVVLWFMHLRFDSPLFRRLFVTGLGVALTVYVIVLLTFRTLEIGDILIAVGLVVAAALVLAAMRRVLARLA